MGYPIYLAFFFYHMSFAAYQLNITSQNWRGTLSVFDALQSSDWLTDVTILLPCYSK